jgi:hypothetical protein
MTHNPAASNAPSRMQSHQMLALRADGIGIFFALVSDGVFARFANRRVSLKWTP